MLVRSFATKSRKRLARDVFQTFRINCSSVINLRLPTEESTFRGRNFRLVDCPWSVSVNMFLNRAQKVFIWNDRWTDCRLLYTYWSNRICLCVVRQTVVQKRTPRKSEMLQMPASADSKNKCVASSSPVTHQTLQQQEGTGEDSYIHLADWTLSVAAIEKKKKMESYTFHLYIKWFFDPFIVCTNSKNICFFLCFHTWFLISPKLRLDLLRQLDKHWQFSLDNVRLTLKWNKQPF